MRFWAAIRALALASTLALGLVHEDIAEKTTLEAHLVGGDLAVRWRNDSRSPRMAICARNIKLKHKPGAVRLVVEENAIDGAYYQRHLVNSTMLSEVFAGVYLHITGVFQFAVANQSFSDSLSWSCPFGGAFVNSLCATYAHDHSKHKFDLNADIKGWRRAGILKHNLDSDVYSIIVSDSEWRHYFGRDSVEPRTICCDQRLSASPSLVDRSLGGSHCSISGSDTEEQRYNEKTSSKDTDYDLPQRKLQHFLRCFGHSLLGNQIIFLTLLGVGCAAVAAVGFLLILDGRGWSRGRLLGVGMLPLFLALGATFWGWAVYGSPWTFWALWGLGSCV